MNTIANKFKKFLAGLAGAVVALVSVPALAQSVGPANFAIPATFSVSQLTTNTTFASSNWLASAVSGGKLGVVLSYKLTAAGSGTVVFRFDSSLDGANWETGAFSISLPANGTAAVTKHGVFDLGPIPYVRLSSVENPNTSAAVTNVVLRYGYKRGI